MCRGPTSVALILLALAAPVLARAGDCDVPAPVAPDGRLQELIVTAHQYDGAPPEELNVLRDARGAFWLAGDALLDWGLALPLHSLVQSGERWYALAEVPGLRYRFDACALALHLDVEARSRSPNDYSMAEGGVVSDTASPGAYLNLDVQHTQVPDLVSTGVLAEAAAFGGAGRAHQTFLVRDGEPLRLESYWQTSRPGDLWSLRLGDTVSRPADWSNPLRYAGLQWGTDFSLQPYLRTFPQPSVRGDTALPSTLDVFVNGNLRGREAAEPGPFELRDIPALSGAGDVVVVVRDALGRETRVAQSFYASPELLRAGLVDYGLDLGWTRDAYGAESDAYGDFLGIATLRRGITDRFTQQVRIEAQGQQAALGATALWLPGTLGLVSGSLAYGQRADTPGGALAALGFERNVSRGISLGLRTQWAEAGFTQAGQASDAPAPRRRDLARMSFAPHPGGSLALAFVDDRRRDAGSAEISSLAYGLRVGARGNLALSLTSTRGDDGRDLALLAGFSWSLGPQRVLGLQQERSSGGALRSNASLQGDPAGPFGLSYRLAAERQGPGDAGGDAVRRGDALASWRTSRGSLTAQAAQVDGVPSYRLGAATGFAFLGGEGFWTRPVNGSFAVVRAEGLGGQDVYADHRVVGRTNADGVALVPDLRPYERNELGFDPAGLPIELELPSLSRAVVPPARSGVLVDFAVAPSAGRMLGVRWPDGSPLAASASVRDLSSGTLLPVSTRGEVYLGAGGTARELEVDQDGRRCRVRIAGKVPSAPLVCSEAAL